MSDQEPKRPLAEKPERMHWIFRVVIYITLAGFVLAMLVFGTCLLMMKH
jgi:hypothetical protein